MKIIFKFTLLLLVVISMIQCKKDPATISMAGQWKMTDIHCDDGVSVTDVLGTEITQTYTYHGIEYNTVTTFTENPNNFSSTGTYTFEITTVFFGQSTTEEVEADAFLGSGEWSIDGDVFTQTFAGQVTEMAILELTGSKMRLRQDVDITLNGTHNTQTVFSTFEKQ
ncbi:MAG TPA: lipocalin family protein [Saprospiraceae bacterium]|nr:lipocalin family protein [Saprospiraceae bacterium]